MNGIGLLSRAVFWVLLVFIVGHGAITALQSGNAVLSLAMLIFFPLTYFIYPWTAGLVAVFVVSLAAYITSTTIGGMAPVDY